MLGEGFLAGLLVFSGSGIGRTIGRDACARTSQLARRAYVQSAWSGFSLFQADCANGSGPAPYDPIIHPEEFVATIDNPYLPLTPGTTFVYEKKTDEGLERVEVRVTGETKEILGVTCVVVNDVETLDGKLVENTYDWYAQDKDGNVWYFGELSMQYEDGELASLEGSWQAGVEGAKPGIIMMGAPAVGEMYRQEFAPGKAEDMGQIMSLSEPAAVPYGSWDSCLQTRDFTPLEPDVLEYKFYAPGVGLVLEVDPESGERVELVDILTGPVGAGEDEE